MMKIEMEFLNSREAARYLGVSYKQLRNLTSSRKIPYYKIGRLNRYKLSELREILEKTRKESLYD